jgi:mRNA interferase YafQ
VKIVYTRQFKKDYKKAKKQDRDLEKLKAVINSLYSNHCLEPSFEDHPLISNWSGFRECHITPDWLLIYKLSPDELLLVRMGSHSELFE